MCGLAGFIGQSSNPELSYSLITRLFEKIEIRGTDAAGFYAYEQDTDVIFYEKCPIKSSDFIKQECWLNLFKHKIDTILVHARKTTKGSGSAWCNSNNHPFVSFDRSLGLIHNGKIQNDEFNYLKLIYDTISDCDSEFLLRIIDASPSVQHGILKIFSLINSGHMAVAVAQKTESNKNLWLFRNQHRPLWIIDLREILNQVFFVSEKRIWDSVIYQYSDAIIKSQMVMELPENQIWNFELSDGNIVFDKSNIFKCKQFEEDAYKQEKQRILLNKIKYKLISTITETDELFSFFIKKLNLLDDKLKKNQIIEFIKYNNIL